MIERNYFAHGREIVIEEFEDVFATRAGIQDGGSGDHALPVGQTKAFEAAGWTFKRGPIGKDDARLFLGPYGELLVEAKRLTVRLEQDLDESECSRILKEEGLTIVRRLLFASNLYEVGVVLTGDVLAISRRLDRRSPFIYAEPQFIELAEQRSAMMDPDYGRQWHLKNTTRPKCGRGDVDAENAWTRATGAGMRLAIIDAGFHLQHPDLSAGAVSGFFDADGEFFQRSTDFPADRHGTFCAGMAVARAQNRHGGRGIAYEADFTAIGCLYGPNTSQVRLARAIAYAANPAMEVSGANPADGAHVICCSFGSGSGYQMMQQVLRDAIDYAVQRGRNSWGTPVFWPVSNVNVPIEADEICSYTNVIAVGRSNSMDVRGLCSYGKNLAFLAPGDDVWSTLGRSGYGDDSGTSFAAPLAAGIAALVLEKDNTIRWDVVREIISKTCDKIGCVSYDTDGRNDYYGFGRVNAAQAVTEAIRRSERL